MSRSAYPNALAQGTRITRYVIKEVLGQGTSGITYLASDKQGKSCTIKEYFPKAHVRRAQNGEVKPNSSDLAKNYDLAVENFSKEAQLIAGFDHPHLISVLDSFQANNTAYFVMPYYDGTTLDSFTISGETLEPDEARHLLGRMWSALEHIHKRKVYHCDIKPANIFITSETGEPILLDFGSAGSADRLGSDHYRAPEQIDGVGPIDERTDIYGLAASLYRLISGYLPADAEKRQKTMSDSGFDALAPLAENDELAAQFGQNFLGGIDKGLHLDPADRPASIADWRKDFAGQAAPTKTAPPPTPAKPKPETRQTAEETAGPTIAMAPESTPWFRYGVLGLILAAILAGGVYVVLQSDILKGEKTKEATAAAETKPAEPAPGETKPEGSKRLSRSEAWVKALEADSLEGYRTYLEQYPTGDNADKAREEIRRFDDEAFQRAERTGTISAYENYISQFPNGQHVTAARAKIQGIRDAQARAAQRARQEAADWQTAAAANTMTSYQTYLDKHPGGKNAETARQRMAEINKAQAETAAFDQAKSLGTKTAYQTYLNSYPQGKYVPQAMAALNAMTPRVGGTIKDCDICPSLVIVAAGGFQQGAGPDDTLARSNEKPERRVDFAHMFAIGTTEITFAQWDACVSAGGCTARPNDQGWGRGNRPVINVTWNDAQKYTAWLSQKTNESYSLPSESQWEYAARAGEIRPWLGGSAKGVCTFANGAGQETGTAWANTECSDPSADRTMAVGTLAANEFGLKDVLGNVAEWTMDCNTLNYRDAPADGSPDMRGACRQRITRGGSWFSGPRDMRLSSRAVLRQGDSNDFTGFRVIRKIRQ